MGVGGSVGQGVQVALGMGVGRVVGVGVGMGVALGVGEVVAVGLGWRVGVGVSAGWEEGEGDGVTVLGTLTATRLVGGKMVGTRVGKATRAERDPT